jgi:KaiC/GvpD/RAD55 family RecA-like ATPase
VIALGDASLSDDKLEHALAAGAGAFILALDNDAAGADGTERGLAVIRKHNARAYVLELPAGIKDPDDLIRERGPAAFVELTKNLASGARWIAARILSRHDTGKDLGRDAAIEDAIAYEDGLADPIETADLMDAITGALGLEPETLEHRLITYKEKRAREERRRGYQELFTRGQALLKDGDLDGLREYVDDKARDLNARALVTLPALYTMGQFERELAETPEGIKTGYESLDGLFSIPQEAITIVAGRPSHGKTTFLMNLLLRMAGLYPDRSFFFFSYEETRKTITAKLVNILGGTVIEPARNFQALEAYLKEKGKGRKFYPQIDAAKETLRGLMDSGRVWIIDAPLYVDELADALATFRERYAIGAVFIDYIQKIKAKGKYPTRQVEIQKISERILEAAKGLSIPVILGAQLGRDKERADKVRLDNLRESGDIEQDANLVLGLHNPAMEKAQAGDPGELRNQVDLTLTVLKNRNGRVNVEQALTFNRPLLRIEESQKAAGSYSGK